ncbi:hypothetical protein [Methylocystis parvus]|uniref:hypothetical protein n=1 Tax=Methylocystis parvus TaxID=134 RepID=UPI003C73662E
MKAPTETQLRAMTPEQRMLVRQRAAKLNNEIGAVTVALIDSLHLPLSSGGMSEDHPLYREMQEVIWSAEAKSAAVKAVEKGLPAMAGVDPILQRVMGERYGREYQGTMNAGYIVGEVMRYLGYDKVGEGPLPEGCVAKTAATWRLIGATKVKA